jgi:hypothetical protein
MSDELPAEDAPEPVSINHTRMEYWSFVAQIVSAFVVIISLIFVGMQLRDGNRVAIRNESNATQEQWSAFRTSIYENRDTAAMLQAGLSGEPLDAPDRIRFLYLIREHGWATYQLWERAHEGLVPMVHFTEGAAGDYLRLICTPGGSAAWAEIKAELPKPFVADLDRLAVPYAKTHTVTCEPSRT